MPSAPRPPAGRYSRPPRLSARARTLAAVSAVVLAVAAIAVLAVLRESSGLHAQQRGYRVLDDRTTEVVFDVTKPPAETARCTVRALDRRFADVGSVEVTVGAAAAATQRVTVTVRTTARAVTGVLRACTLSG